MGKVHLISCKTQLGFSHTYSGEDHKFFLHQRETRGLSLKNLLSLPLPDLHQSFFSQTPSTPAVARKAHTPWLASSRGEVPFLPLKSGAGMSTSATALSNSAL